MSKTDFSHDLLRFSDEVKEALHSGKPVVALESTVIAHGLPYPENVATARKIEAAVRAEGAIPATIGIENGRFLIGMSDADLERFGSTRGIPKASSRDIPAAWARPRWRRRWWRRIWPAFLSLRRRASAAYIAAPSGRWIFPPT